MDKREIGESENKLGFLSRYQLEPDAQNRLTMAGEFLLHEAGDKWLFAYVTIASKVGEISDSNRESSKEIQKTVERENDEGKVNPVVEKIFEYQEHYQFRQAFLKAYAENRSDKETFTRIEEESKKADDLEWSEISRIFDVDDDPYINLNIEWLRYMISHDRVDIQSKGNGGSSGILSFTNSGLSVEGSDPPRLHITRDLIPSDRTAASLLLGLAHERGHVARLESRKYLTDELGQTEIVLSEFYSICEEYRIYHMLPEKLKEQVDKDAVKYLYEPNVSNINYRGTLPNTNIAVDVKLDVITFILYRAYDHALQQNMGARKILFEKLTHGQSDVETAKKYWSEVLKIKENEPVLSNTDFNWKAQ